MNTLNSLFFLEAALWHVPTQDMRLFWGTGDSKITLLMDGWMNGRMAEWMDGWVNCICTLSPSSGKRCNIFQSWTRTGSSERFIHSFKCVLLFQFFYCCFTQSETQKACLFTDVNTAGLAANILSKYTLCVSSLRILRLCLSRPKNLQETPAAAAKSA